MKSEIVTIPLEGGELTSGTLSVLDQSLRNTGIIIAHGAGNDMNHPFLVHLAEGLAQAGYPTLRFNFLYKEQGRKVPDRPEVLHLAWKAAYTFFVEHSEVKPKFIVGAGKSLGARIASQMAAEGKLAVDRLVFLGYPLHAPGKTEKLRDAHLYGIKIPMLFFEGTRDPFCDLNLLDCVLARLTAPWELQVIEGGDHSFNVPKSAGKNPVEIYEFILEKMNEWLNAGERDRF